MGIKELAENYNQATESFLEAVARISPADLDRAPGGEWTPRQVIHHQAHADAYCLTRIIQVISEPGSSIRSFSESALVNSGVLAYSTTPIESSLALFKAVRAEALRIIKSASDSDLSNSCTHSELGEISFEAMIVRFTEHPLGHARQIQEAIGG
jgi:hypothetical protein